MNDWDKNNLEFMLSLTPEQFEDWYDSISTDDAEYALELLQQAQTQVAMHVLSLNDEIEDLTLANKVLAKFRLTK